MSIAAEARTGIERKRPNIIVIWADNMGWGDLSCYGCRQYTTPHLDALAREGVLFQNSYASAPMCTPSRVAFFTGRYPSRLQIGLQEPLAPAKILGDRVNIGLPTDIPTLPSLLQAAGYETSLIGKWHCGHPPHFSPLKSGFDRFYGYRSGAIDYFRHHDSAGVHDFWEDDEEVVADGYATDLFSQRAVDIVKAEREKPFFLTLWYNAPHWPWEGPRDKYLSDELAGYDSNRAWMETGTSENYAEVVRSLDAGIGSVLQALKDSGQEEDTLVIFSADQGGDEMANLGPLRRGRLHDGGIKVPMIVRWPGVTQAGLVTPQVAMGFDQTATILAAAGVAPDPAYPLEGDDLLPILRGTREPYERELYWRHWGNPRPGIPLQQAVRQGDFKYLKVHEDEFLFDLAADPTESLDVKDEYPQKFEELRQKYERWNADKLIYDKAQPEFRRVLFQ